ncbi:MAG: hypothetical protein RIA71_05640 [Oceanicaulis sp.]
MSRTVRRRSAAGVFAIPVLIAGVSLFGLVAALIGEGAYDLLGWLALAAPVAATLWARFLRA